MKQQLLLLMSLCFLMGNVVDVQAQTKKEWKKHFKKIAKSKKKKSMAHSMDTLFYAGAPYCVFKKLEAQNTQERVTPSYNAYSLNGEGPILIKQEELTGCEGLYYSFIYDQNGWEMKQVLELLPLAMKKQLMNSIKKSSVFGTDGKEFSPQSLDNYALLRVDEISEIAKLVGSKEKDQDMSVPIEIDTDKGTIKRAGTLIGRFVFKGEGKEKMLGIKYASGLNPFAVMKVPSEAGKMTIIEQDRKGTNHEMELQSINNLIKEVAEFLARKELL